VPRLSDFLIAPCAGLLIARPPLHGRPEIGLAHDVVAIEDRARAVARDLHRDALRPAGADHVAHAAPAQVVEQPRRDPLLGAIRIHAADPVQASLDARRGPRAPDADGLRERPRRPRVGEANIEHFPRRRRVEGQGRRALLQSPERRPPVASGSVLSAHRPEPEATDRREAARTLQEGGQVIGAVSAVPRVTTAPAPP